MGKRLNNEYVEMGDKPNSDDGTDQTLAENEIHRSVDDVILREMSVHNLEYNLKERPPILVIIGAALQHVLMCTPNGLAIPFIVADTICAEWGSPIRTTLVSSTQLMTGVCTLLQTALGVRLPMIQGPSGVFMAVVISLQNQDGWRCPGSAEYGNSMDMALNTTVNLTYEDHSSPTDDQFLKLKKLSGSLMAASLVEILIGGTGLVGFLLQFVGPITVAPVLSLLGLSLVKVVLRYGASSWIITIVSIVLILIFALYMGHLQLRVPVPNTRCLGRSRKTIGAPIFRLLPVLLSVIVMWLVCWILTHFNVFPDDETHPNYRARTDAKSHLTQRAPWFYLPYPGQFGMPSFDVALFIGYIVAFFASIIESVGDYFAAAKACEVSSPPPHAVNRGILLEGVGGFITGVFGTGIATTTYSGNIAEMTLTKTANRYVMYCAGLILVLVSVLGKFGAALASIPDPVLAGAVSVIFGMLVALGLSTLQYVDLNSARNLLILGTAFFAGWLFPQWIQTDPNLINTGNLQANNILRVVFGTPMILGGLIAFILDNTARGSRKERGIDSWQRYQGGDETEPPRREQDSHLDRSEMESGKAEDFCEGSDILGDSTYTWPCLRRLYNRLPVCSRLPFMPSSVPENRRIDHCDNTL